MNFPLQNIGLQPPTTTFKHLNVVLLQGLRGAIDGILLHILGHVRVFDHGLQGRWEGPKPLERLRKTMEKRFLLGGRAAQHHVLKSLTHPHLT